jgi:hypothetical protein
MESNMTVAKAEEVETAAWISSTLTSDKQVNSDDRVAKPKLKGIWRSWGLKTSSWTTVLPVQAEVPAS